MLKKAAKANEEFAQLIGKLVMSPTCLLMACAAH